MKRLLILAALSVAALAETAPQATAWWPCLGCNSGCESRCHIRVSCRPFNAFSPCCSVNVRGNFNGLGGCCGGRQGSNQPYGAWGHYGQGYGLGCGNGGGYEGCGGCGNGLAGIQPFCPVMPMPFAAPASVAAACGGERGAGKCGFLGRLGRRIALEPQPNDCDDCGNGRRHHRESWWARFSRHQYCCSADACGVTEYTCGGCNNDCGGCNSAPSTAPLRPVAPPKPLPQ